MLAGVLALMLVASDTTLRSPTTLTDTLPEAATVVSPAPAAIDTARVPVDTAPVFALVAQDTPWLVTARAGAVALTPADTVVKKKKPVLVSYSDWYGRRLAIHRTLTWAMIPLFAASYYTGERLARDGRPNSPYWVRALHPYAATATTVIFGANTFTGLWNLWDARHDPEGRTRRIVHSLLFLASDAGFAYAGSIGNKGRNDGEVRNLHRQVALYSMGASYFSIMLMLLGGK